MRKRKENSETLVSNHGEGDEEINREEEDEEEGEKGFFACYLLCSLNPRFKGHTYIGFTINPRRRIRQHNGEIMCGAWKTKTKRPWEMILCIYGFPTNVSALQFEWAWQHPTKSLAVRKAAVNFKSLSGIANKIKLAYTMLTLPPWQGLKLTVNFFSTKYNTNSSGCPSLPKQMKVQVFPMNELPCYTDLDPFLDENDENRNGDRDLNGRTDISEHHCSIVGTAHDQPRWIDDDGLRQPVVYPLAPQEDHRLPFHLVDSSPRTSSSSITGFVNTVKTVEYRDPFGLIEESSGEFDQSTKRRQTTPTRHHRLPFHLVDSPLRTSSSSITGLVNTGKTIEDRDPFGLIEESRGEFDQSTKQRQTTPTVPNNDEPTTSFELVEEDKLGQGAKQPPPVTSKVANKDPPLLFSKPLHFSPGVEVINVSSPSSESVIRFRKKKRASSIHPKIIDLTESPIFIQL